MKKSLCKIFSVLLCFVFILFAGCDAEDLEDSLTGGDSSLSSILPQSLDGVKGLMKPGEYDISELVGINSQYYYNIFANNVSLYLYQTYANLLPTGAYADVRENIFANTSLASATSAYYYDSIRYTISEINYTYDENSTLESVTIVLDTLKGWKLGVQNYTSYTLSAISGSDVSSYFSSYTPTVESGKITIEYGGYVAGFTDGILDAFSTPTSYGDFYYSSTMVKNENYTDSDEPLYWESPYYNLVVEEQALTSYVNFYQDVIEYATYLIVLGYDYENEDDADYFNFTPTYDTSGNVTGVNVGGWGSDLVSITTALANAKELYAKQGSYVGLTETNKIKIMNFILDKMIGVTKDGDTYVSSSAINVYGTQYGSTKTLKNTISIDREYEQVVSNIIDYACEQVLIGGEKDVADSIVNIDEPFPISQIVDFDGDYFFVSMSNGDEDDDSDPMKYIEEAEWQSLSLNLMDDYIGYDVTDIWLVFEYGTGDYENYLDELTINVGINYYNSTTGELSSYGSYQITVVAGITALYADYENGIAPDSYNTITICDYEAEADLYIGSGIPVSGIFDTTIEALDTSNGTLSTDGHSKSIQITGNSTARQYYKLNDSSSYGQYGTFDGADGVNSNFYGVCDYLEIYFDVVKTKGVENADVNYEFKVGLWNFSTTFDNPFSDDEDDTGSASFDIPYIEDKSRHVVK